MSEIAEVIARSLVWSTEHYEPLQLSAEFEQAIRTIEALEAAGYVIVPKEATPEMAQALESNYATCEPPSEVHRANWAEAYRNMLDVRPK